MAVKKGKKNGLAKKEELPSFLQNVAASADLEAAREAADAAQQAEHDDLKEDLGQQRVNIKNFMEVIGSDRCSVVVFHQHRSNAYWKAGKPEDGTPPACQAPDGRTGHGDIGREGGPPNVGVRKCVTCEWNKFGSGQGRGKKCKNSRLLWFYRLDNRTPTTPQLELLQIPPTSLKAVAEYLEEAISDEVDYFGHATIVTVHDPPMGTLTFERGEKLSKGMADAMLALNYKHREDFASFIEDMEEDDGTEAAEID